MSCRGYHRIASVSLLHLQQVLKRVSLQARHIEDLFG